MSHTVISISFLFTAFDGENELTMLTARFLVHIIIYKFERK